MGKKLSITQRAYDKTGWHKSSQFSTSDIKDIKTFKARNDKSLNAIPSPFARLHLFEAAFDLLDKDELNGTDDSGDTFKKIVSDCFDVFELLYNWNNHIRQGHRLSITRWNRQAEISQLKNGSKRHRLLGETFETFLHDESFTNYDEIIIIKLNNQPIAGTSPFTGFFTRTEGLQNIDLFNPLNKGNYFSKIIPFRNRKEEVKRYIIDFFENNYSLKSSPTTTVIRTYLRKYFDSVSFDTEMPLEKLSLDDKQSIEVFGQPLLTSSGITEVDLFEKYLLRLNYQLNDAFFHNPIKEAKPSRDYDYILPLTTTFFEEFQPADIPKMVSIKELGVDSVEVTILLGKQKLSKTYHTKNIFGLDGQLIDLAESHGIKLNLGIYPFLKVTNTLDNKDYNDFYKVGFYLQDNDRKYGNADFSLRFGKNGRVIEGENIYHLRRDERTLLNDKTAIGTTYYSLNTVFDYIQIVLPSINGQNIRGIIVPKWQEKAVGNKKIDYSVDFGTTTTFIAYTDSPGHSKEPQPLEVKENELQIIMLNKPTPKRTDLSMTAQYDLNSIPNFMESIQAQKQEFLPSIISKLPKETYKFPIRTALFQKHSIPDNLKSLFANSNIAFTYQREDNNLTQLNQDYVTNLKWNIKTDNSYRTSIRIFLEELFYLLRTKTILNEGDPQKTSITWFSPLSFTPASKDAYAEIWDELYKKVFVSNSSSNVHNLTESEAPYYYLYKGAAINNATAVLTIDIGGGSSDMMFFSESNPVLGTSVHFGANVLWGSGFNEFGTDKSNGIYETIKDKVANNLKSTSLKHYNENVMTNYGSDEIINFWLLNNQHSEVIKELKHTDFKLTYLLHLTALIYHSVKLLKASNYKPLTCIIFSGNGSKYIDLIQTKETIQKVCGYVLRSVYNNADLTNPQVILPEENRKEATCYGGLYRPETAHQFKPVNYLGFEDTPNQYKKYSEIDVHKDVVIGNVLQSFNEFVDMFFKMNDEPGLSFRSNFGIEIKTQGVQNFIKQKAEESLRMGFDKRRRKVDSQDDVSDSLFFYPLVGLIYKLNRLSPIELNNYIPRSIIYGLSPDSQNEFSIERLTSIKKPDSIFTITILDDNPNLGELRLIEQPEVYKRAIGALEGYLQPVSDWEHYPQPGSQEIKILKPGLVEREGNKWVVKERMQLQFV